jgi:cytochrome oxidase Cu insertion factor (SCO1/SenC/PrrC family)
MANDNRRDRPRSRGKRAVHKSNSAPTIVAVVVVSILIVGGGGALAYFRSPGKKTQPVASHEPGGSSIPPAGGPVGLEVGNMAPEIDGEDIDGHRFKLSDYRGKVVVLDFWGHW